MEINARKWTGLVVAGLVLSTSSVASATSTTLDGTLDSPLVLGDVTLYGGQYLYDPVSYIPGSSGVYASSSTFGGVYSNPLTIEFSTPPTLPVKLVTWNRSGSGGYINGIQHNSNGVKVIDAVEVSSGTYEAAFNFSNSSAPGSEWEFGIIGYRIGIAGPLQFFEADAPDPNGGSAIPEPVTLLACGAAFGGLGGYIRRRRV
jgi:hypothetical protein